ncbi:probable cytochrome P450 12a4, mitochondrial [Stegodyphus dumicola]|uniref:probable cytochrome P450 12a4, mitochondrial n=1 Tax=Stegodyphus dumicola TaxID=202533 RepID=UPI0015A9603A|nr:probable cytochrome P450 12a4, mitochondrial [Stegodyphus dumicola]
MVLGRQGKEWHDLRSKTQKHLLKPKAIQAYLGAMEDVARDFVQKIYETRDSNKEIPGLLGELYKWALEFVAFVGLDTRLGCLETNLPPDSDGMKMINSVQTQFDCMNKLEAFSGNIQFWKYFPTPTWKKFTMECDVFTQIAFKYINRAMEELKKKEGNEDKELTLLQALLATKGLDVSGAMVTVADMLMAGIDTTSHSVGYMLYNLARFPEKQQILYEEISRLLPSKDLRITQEVFSELRYLKSCMKESQRMDPVVSGTVRQLENDVVLSGYKVPAGTLIAVILQEIYRDERYFKNPEKFLPERWLEKEDKHHPYAFLPFGFGTRSCIGRRLAELETISLMTEIIRNFKLEYHHEEIDMLTRMINVPDKPLRINFIEKRCRSLLSKNWHLDVFEKNGNIRTTSTITANVGTRKDSLWGTTKPFEDIPHLTMLPIIGTAWAYLPIIGRYKMDKLHLATRHKRQLLGDIIREKFGHLNMVATFNPDDMETVFRNEGPYPNRSEFSTMKAYRESRKEWYKTTGIMVLQGKEWHDLRSKTQKHLLKPKAIQAYLGAMQDVARDFVQKVYETRDSNKEVPDLLGEIYKWALESVAFVGLDTRLGCLKTNLPPDSDGMKMIRSVQTQFECMNKLEAFLGNIQLWKYFPTPTWKKFTRECDIFTDLENLHKALEELKKNEENEDKELTLLQAMLSTEGLDASGAMVTVADMLTAGIDTTANSMGFLLYNLAKNPDKQQVLYEEISKLLPSKNHRITPKVFSELKYLKSCMKESQRTHPIIAVSIRQLERDVILSGYNVPAGTLIAVALQEIYRDEKYFKNPEKFLPERWLGKEDKYHPYAFLPFGFGTRSCIGRRLAELETISLMTEIIRNFKVEYHYEDIDMLTRTINAPDKPLRINFIER